MLLGMPVSWILVEVFSLILFLIVVVHATRQENSTFHVLTLFGFIISAALFENVGVNIGHTYWYDVRRIMMVGSVPLEILLLEAVIWYAAFALAGRLGLPAWAKPFVVGLFGSVQDMTIDPAAVFDRHPLTDPALASHVNQNYPGALGDGNLSGQWNWTNPGYDGGFFGIPVFNFSGWFTLMLFYSFLIVLGLGLSQRYRKPGLALATPFVAAVLNVICLATPINVFLIMGTPLFPAHSVLGETILLCVNYGFSIGLLAVFFRRRGPIDLRRDGMILFCIPIALHVYDVFSAVALGNVRAYLPVLVVSAIHVAWLYFVYRMRPQGPSVPKSR